MSDTELRIYLIVRGDLDMPMGKAMAQAGHAFSTVVLKVAEADPALLALYYQHSQPKIVVKCKNEEALLRAERECSHLHHYLVTDAGRTLFPEPTTTCLAVGPVSRSALPTFVQRMRLL